LKGKLSIMVLSGGVVLIALGALSLRPDVQTVAQQRHSPNIPKMWDDKAMATLEVPLADPKGSPKHAPSDYYYRIPVRPIYKSYAWYAPGHEPPGYFDWLKKQEPVLIWDGGHRPPLQTEADWISAGEIVFHSSIDFLPPVADQLFRNRKLFDRLGFAVAKDGVFPFFQYVIREKGNIELGVLSCSMCHTRTMPDGSILNGAQANLPMDWLTAYEQRQGGSSVEEVRNAERIFFASPWLHPDPLAPLQQMSIEEIARAHDAIPPGVMSREGSSLFFPPHVPDLTGVKDRHYLDATGLQQHRSIVDLMRYAALNQGGDDLASYDGFVPAKSPDFEKVAARSTRGRYSDEQLYALALYVYSLQPPKNPNKLDALAERGEKVFESEGCAGCHTPPLYTNNMLTPAEGFTPPEADTKKYDILPISVGTDPNLTMKTRRGTGYYKVPSLKGVWYRSMFGHNGWCARLEDWFDASRLHGDYVPTGFKPYGVKTFAVKGHPFGLSLSADDKKALIAFLKTL
jgi:Di-haem oxidoreductase, putative peroxidase